MSWWRSLLNLPPKGEHWSDRRRTRKPGNAGRENTGPEWWAQPEVSGGVMAPPRRPQPPASRAVTPQGSGHRPPERLQQRSPHGANAAPQTLRPPNEPGQTPWATEHESSFTTWARRFFRGLVVAVLILAAISGVRSWIRPESNSATVATADSGFPKDDARAVATRFSVAYLTWDEANPDARPAAISMDLAAGLDEQVGWNGRGRQTTGAAYPGEVTVDPGGVTAKVDVRILVRPSTKSGRAWVLGHPSWRRLSVPVARTPGRVVVTGPPTFVADLRAALPDNMPEAGVPDDNLTAATKQDAEAFFSAYAESDAKVAAVTAPDAAIKSLNGSVKLDQLTDWQVYTGNDDERQATAAVTWDGTGDTTLAQTYTLTLRRTVAANGAQRWQVAAVG